MSERFFYPELDAGAEIGIGGREAHHILNVMHLGPGAAIELFDGEGRRAPATIETTSRRTLVARVGVPVDDSRELPLRLQWESHCPRETARFLVEKLTELGVARLVPLDTSRSTIHTGKGTVARLRQYVIEACKQCGRNRLMQVDEITPLAAFAAEPGDSGPAIAFDPTAENLLATGDFADQAAATFGIGPEGGWTPAERELLAEHAWQLRSLGLRVLRTETAAMAAAAFVAVQSLGRQ